MEVAFNKIGIIHTPYKNKEGMPIQSIGGRGIKGYIEIFPEFAEGLKDLDGFSHIILIYHFHLSSGYSLIAKPFLSEIPKGIFAIRSPKRPNPIGLSIVKLIDIKDNIINIENIDIIDGTPLLDIKPYIPATDFIENATVGWLDEIEDSFVNKKSDDRFGNK